MNNYNAYRENYPVDFEGLNGVEVEHKADINGEFFFKVYAGEDPEEVLRDNLMEFIRAGIENGTIEIN